MKRRVPLAFGCIRRIASRPNRKPPKQQTLLEILGVHLDDLSRRIVAGVVDRQIKIGTGAIEQRDDVGFLGGIGNHGNSFFS